jgi:lipid A 3-O-deacylase
MQVPQSREAFQHGVQLRRPHGRRHAPGRREAADLSLRLQHVSNAGIKEPNPGENFVQLRYARRL